MRTWPKHPVIYEINTWVWLTELCQRVVGHLPDSRKASHRT